MNKSDIRRIQPIYPFSGGVSVPKGFSVPRIRASLQRSIRSISMVTVVANS